MDQDTIEIVAFDESHLQEAHRLSREAGWLHRLEDWAMQLKLSQGFVALHAGKVVGTAMMTPFGEVSSTINMVIVDASLRGRGLGRRLMDIALQACGTRECCLVATADGLPLYEKLGFRATHEICQHQGLRPGGALLTVDRAVEWAQAGDLAAIAELDRQALGLARQNLLRLLSENAQVAVLRNGGGVTAFGALRPFGRGEVIGPVIAADAEQAQAILSFLMNSRPGAFLRVDTAMTTGLSPWLATQGLEHVGGGIAMRRQPQRPAPTGPAQCFALASQALG